MISRRLRSTWTRVQNAQSSVVLSSCLAFISRRRLRLHLHARTISHRGPGQCGALAGTNMITA
ncbi:hypothetical protein BD310DRAFT_927424 [Dichomitus squalens]|uniref:Uncharacterized protein n=1 Tax=Dichomitus squalens TaxID=114155 RepID=A0A4Q9PV56_9APHY|nr:hypothetical protein BD310DRAFT_927424 [Dichomitus squalens]